MSYKGSDPTEVAEGAPWRMDFYDTNEFCYSSKMEHCYAGAQVVMMFGTMALATDISDANKLLLAARLFLRAYYHME